MTPSPSVRDVGQAQQPPPPTQATESQADASAPPPPTAAPPMPEAGSEDWVYVDKTVEEVGHVECVKIITAFETPFL